MALKSQNHGTSLNYEKKIKYNYDKTLKKRTKN